MPSSADLEDFDDTPKRPPPTWLKWAIPLSARLWFCGLALGCFYLFYTAAENSDFTTRPSARMQFPEVALFCDNHALFVVQALIFLNAGLLFLVSAFLQTNTYFATRLPKLTLAAGVALLIVQSSFLRFYTAYLSMSRKELILMLVVSSGAIWLNAHFFALRYLFISKQARSASSQPNHIKLTIANCLFRVLHLCVALSFSVYCCLDYFEMVEGSTTRSSNNFGIIIALEFAVLCCVCAFWRRSSLVDPIPFFLSLFVTGQLILFGLLWLSAKGVPGDWSVVFLNAIAFTSIASAVEGLRIFEHKSP